MTMTASPSARSSPMWVTRSASPSVLPPVVPEPLLVPARPPFSCNRRRIPPAPQFQAKVQIYESYRAAWTCLLRRSREGMAWNVEHEFVQPLLTNSLPNHKFSLNEFSACAGVSARLLPNPRPARLTRRPIRRFALSFERQLPRFGSIRQH